MECGRSSLVPFIDGNGLTRNHQVCVLGLRVYSQDSETKITLVKPKNPEEGASLNVDDAPAGATM